MKNFLIVILSTLGSICICVGAAMLTGIGIDMLYISYGYGLSIIILSMALFVMTIVGFVLLLRSIVAKTGFEEYNNFK
jgi:hypothetical protein